MAEDGSKRFELTGEQRERVAKWIMDKWKPGTTCPLCGIGPWNVPQYVVAARAAPPDRLGDLVMGGPLYPLIPISCDNCTNTVFINAMLIPGVLSKGESSAPR